VRKIFSAKPDTDKLGLKDALEWLVEDLIKEWNYMQSTIR
jgi:hypothetical protein